MKNNLLLTSLVFLTGACATTVGTTTSGPNAPANNTVKNGSVAYNPSGLKDLVDARRESALKKIVAQCGSNKYKIVKDEVRKKGTDADSIATLGANELQYIDFECE